MGEHDDGYATGGNVARASDPKLPRRVFRAVFGLSLVLLIIGEIILWTQTPGVGIWTIASVLLLCAGVILGVTGWIFQGRMLAMAVPALIVASVILRILLVTR